MHRDFKPFPIANASHPFTVAFTLGIYGVYVSIFSAAKPPPGSGMNRAGAFLDFCYSVLLLREIKFSLQQCIIVVAYGVVHTTGNDGKLCAAGLVITTAPLGGVIDMLLAPAKSKLLASVIVTTVALSLTTDVTA